MIKNVKLKKVLKGSVFKVVSLLNRAIPKRDDYILLYAANKGISFNLKPLLEYLEEHRLYKENKIICGIENMKYAEQGFHCTYVTHVKSIILFLRTKHVFYTAGQIPIKPSKDQIVLHLQHGTTFKTCGALTKINNGDEFFFSYCVATSPIYKSIYSRAFRCKEKNVIVNSEPVTDIFFNGYRKYDLGYYKKIILWVPTFRQSDYLGYDDSTEEELLPLLEERDYAEFNSLLQSLNYRLIVKIHPSQDLSKYKQLKYSNMQIMSNQDFENEGYELYNLLPQIDVMLADYSSLFLQFLLLDKPLAFVIPDIDDYSRLRGFVFDNPEAYMPGPKIKTKKQFIDYLLNMDSENIKYNDARKRVKKIIHTYSDGKSCERLMQLSRVKYKKG